MPIYEYQCEHCHQHCEKLQKISDQPIVDCPACGKSALKRLISAAGFQLKGSGWYVTDFRDKKSGQSANKEVGSSGKKEATADSAAVKKTDTSSSNKE